MLLSLEVGEAFGHLQVVQRMRPRGSTYFINTFLTYCTVLLRIPKRGVLRGFRSCFGFRRRGIDIPKRAIRPFFGIVADVVLWITFREPAALGHAVREHLQAGRKRAAAEHRVFGNVLECLDADDLNGLGRMAQGLADQTEVVRIQLHGLEWCQGLVMQDVEVALDAAGLGIASPANEAEPACQAQESQGAGNCFVRGLRATGHGRQPGPELLIGGECGETIVVEQQAKHLPGVALQWCEPSIQKQCAGHALVTVAAVEEPIRGDGGGRGLLLGRKGLQGAVEQV
ncbi:hypothetical protein M002_01335 [Pseudomonas aeruginosa ID4365]|nr:hypothetical protein M002_01335 [Pseudomonas aeruginosa ID4365]